MWLFFHPSMLIICLVISVCFRPFYSMSHCIKGNIAITKPVPELSSVSCILVGKKCLNFLLTGVCGTEQENVIATTNPGRVGHRDVG